MDRFFFEASDNFSVIYANFSRERFTAVIANHNLVTFKLQKSLGKSCLYSNE